MQQSLRYRGTIARYTEWHNRQDTHVYEVALGGSVHETGIRWDVHTFPLVGHTQKL